MRFAAPVERAQVAARRLAGLTRKKNPHQGLAAGLILRVKAGESRAVKVEHTDDPAALAAYDPFYLVCAEPDAAAVLAWDGVRAAIRDLAADTQVRARMGAAGRARVVAEFSEATVAEQTLALIRRALVDGAPREKGQGKGRC